MNSSDFFHISFYDNLVFLTNFVFHKILSFNSFFYQQKINIIKESL